MKKDGYKDMAKFRAAYSRQKRKYYAKTRVAGYKRWTEEEDKMVLAHIMTDTELSQKIGHGVAAIQRRRYYLKTSK